MNQSEWSLLKRTLLKSIHPGKPIYRKVERRNGRDVYERICWKVGDNYVFPRRNPYIQVQLQAGDPAKQKRDRKIARFFRKIRRSMPWWARPKGFLKGLFQI